jgi:hypothetical protein
MAPVLLGALRESAFAIDGDLEGGTQGAHPPAAEDTESLDQHGHGDALDGVQVGNASFGDGVVAWFEDDLAGQATDGGRARSDQRAPQSGDGCVA